VEVILISWVARFAVYYSSADSLIR